MEPVKYEVLPAFRVMGLEYIGNNAHQEIHLLWSVLNTRIKEIPEQGNYAYGVCSMLPGSKAGWMEYVAGLKVSPDADVPEGMVIFDVPKNNYAVFEHRGSLETLGNTYRMIQEWWQRSDKQQAGKYDMEVYDEKFKDFRPDSVFYIYEPVN
jgi:AraC family transcriptional regulator